MNNRFSNTQSTTKRHRVFVSYYHKDDEKYRDRFERLFSDIHDRYDSESVKMGDIDDTKHSTKRIHQIIREDYLRNSTVTVVLVGARTWKRKFVDWEIGSSIRHTESNHRSGLLGILLPTYQISSDVPHTDRRRTADTLHSAPYDPHTIPPRLHENIECGFAKIYKWSKDPDTVQAWIHEAFKRRDKNPPPHNSRDLFKDNRPRSQERWE